MFWAFIPLSFLGAIVFNFGIGSGSVSFVLSFMGISFVTALGPALSEGAKKGDGTGMTERGRE